MATTLCKKILTRFHDCHDVTQEINRRKKSTNKLEQERGGEKRKQDGLHERAPRFLVSHA
jgi:hypothetical protein